MPPSFTHWPFKVDVWWKESPSSWNYISHASLEVWERMFSNSSSPVSLPSACTSALSWFHTGLMRGPLRRSKTPLREQRNTLTAYKHMLIKKKKMSVTSDIYFFLSALCLKKKSKSKRCIKLAPDVSDKSAVSNVVKCVKTTDLTGYEFTHTHWSCSNWGGKKVKYACSLLEKTVKIMV